ncbi:MAG: hypothetical protein ABJD11_11370 [Gemmatimonadota bacterium]
MSPIIREARLKPEFAQLYPEIHAGVWCSAALLSARRLARVRSKGDHDSLTHVLDPAHFEYRGGQPRKARSWAQFRAELLAPSESHATTSGRATDAA